MRKGVCGREEENNAGGDGTMHKEGSSSFVDNAEGRISFICGRVLHIVPILIDSREDCVS